MELHLLQDVVIILGLSVFVIFLLQRLKLPVILGLLLTGLIAGPHGLSLVKASHEVDIMAEIGVILLLFTIGMEFSLKRLASIRKAVLLGGSIQVVVTILVVFGVTKLFGFGTPQAIFLGLLFSLSSTAIILKLLQEKGELNSPHGQSSLAILIYQDIIVVPMMLFTPILAGQGGNIATTLLWLILKGVFIIAIVFISARFLVPTILYQIVKTKSKELFILAVVVICFSVTWLSSELGLSLSLGAFMAGLIISESEYSHQATSTVLPFREVFTSFFFVSMGMLLNTTFLIQHIWLILALTVLTIIIKASIASIAAFVLRYPLRTVILIGFILFQVGEFSLILSRTGMEYNLLTESTYQYFLSISILTMGITPFVIEGGRKLAEFVGDKKEKAFGTEPQPIEQGAKTTDDEEVKDHVVIVGFGINGENLAKAARYANIPYRILELNAKTVKEQREKGEPIIFGDPVHPHILEEVNIEQARIVVIAISDPTAIRNIISNIRSFSKKVHIIVRTRYLSEMDELFKLGADEVIPEEFETSIEIFTRVMSNYLIPSDEIESFTREIRRDSYDMLRSFSDQAYHPQQLPNIQLSAIKVEHDANPIAGKKVQDSDLRNNYGINLVAIKRGDDITTDITKDTVIKVDDVLYVFGHPDKIKDFHKLLKT